MERAYTVAEVDALRVAVEYRWRYGTANMEGGNRQSRAYYPADKDAAIESLLRTHMLAGHIAQDIYDADTPKADPPQNPQPRMTATELLSLQSRPPAP